MSHRRIQIGLLIVTMALLGLSLYKPIYPRDQLLLHTPTLVGMILLFVAAWRGWLSTTSMLCIIGFTWLHILGSRWVYLAVPYDAWAQAIFGADITGTFGFTRNHYDRLVHLASGMLFMPPLFEIISKELRGRYWWAATFSISIILAGGAAYEVFEWVLTLFVSDERAANYNGQQGDAWDAQKDMGLALAGALLIAPILVWRGRAADADRVLD